MNSKERSLIRGVCVKPIVDIVQSATKGLNTTEISTDQMNIVKYFENFPLKSGARMYSFNNNSPYSTIYLSQDSFATGTVRITSPGYYSSSGSGSQNPCQSLAPYSNHLRW